MGKKRGYLSQFIQLLYMTTSIIFGRGQFGRKERINECGFTQTTFTFFISQGENMDKKIQTLHTNDHDCEVSPLFGDDFMFLKKSQVNSLTTS